MIAELEKEVEANFPCFIKEDGVKVGDVLNASMFLATAERIDSWSVTVTKMENLIIWTTKTEMTTLAGIADRDGSILKKFDDRWNLIGYTYNAPALEFIRMSFYVDTLCDWAGICEAPISTTTPVATNTPIPIKSMETVEKNEEGAENGKKRNGFVLVLLYISLFL
uniref:Uncharacterized protein n=1 Tax=Caenorhabditis tropicalis TaxID=1561998 RepID=A0A1I7TIM9_9PELO